MLKQSQSKPFYFIHSCQIDHMTLIMWYASHHNSSYGMSHTVWLIPYVKLLWWNEFRAKLCAIGNWTADCQNENGTNHGKWRTECFEYNNSAEWIRICSDETLDKLWFAILYINYWTWRSSENFKKHLRMKLYSLAVIGAVTVHGQE